MPPQRIAPSVRRLSQHVLGAQSELRRKAPRFTSAPSRTGGCADRIEDLGNDEDCDDSRRFANDDQARKWRHAAVLPESLKTDEQDVENELDVADQSSERSSDEDDNNDDDDDVVSSQKTGKRRHHLSVSERSRFVIPRLSGPTLATQSSNTMPLSDTVQKWTPARPSFKFASKASSPPRVPPVFSPRRRGEKFLPDGLASIVRAWVMEAAQTSNMNLSLTVEDCRVNDGFVFVGGQDMIAILAGLETSIPHGSIVNITRGWSVDIKHPSTWIVGVEWDIGEYSKVENAKNVS